MSENSKIEWTDHTFNPWIGCTKVSPGCAHCYAETLMDTRYGRVKWGKGNPRQRTSDANWKQPLKWNRESAQGCAVCEAPVGECQHENNRRPRVFCASLADWLDDEVPIELLASLLDLIRQTPNLDWLLLTKRPQNFRRVEEAGRRLESDGNWDILPKDHPAVALHAWIGNWTILKQPPINVWIGTTVEDQERADERIPALLKIPAVVRFLSCEPLLGPVDLKLDFDLISDIATANPNPTRIHWVICGGESGKDARPMHPDWARSLRDQCAAAGVPFLFKQWGEWTQRCLLTIDGKPYGGSADFSELDPMCEKWASVKMCDCGGDARTDCGPLKMCACENGGHTLYVQRVGNKAAGRILDGREHNDFPEVRP